MFKRRFIELKNNENQARDRFYESLAAPSCSEASIAKRKLMRKRFSEEYYKKDE